MTLKLRIAITAQVALMMAGLVTPLVVKALGTTVYLETVPVDPRSLWRGDYVTLGYAAGQEVLSQTATSTSRKQHRTLYVTLTSDRPAQFVAADFERPTLEEGQVCLAGRIRKSGNQTTIDFPQISQYFVPEGRGREIENQLGRGLQAEVKVTSRCNAVLVGLVP